MPRPLTALRSIVLIAAVLVAAVLVAAALLAAARPAAARPSQDAPLSDVRAEHLAEREDAAAAGEALAEHLALLADDPLDVNAATAEALAVLPGLDAALAARIVAHRTAHGPFRTPDALLAVPGLDAHRLVAFRPYVTTAARARRLRVAAAQRLARRLGPPDDAAVRYAGGPVRATTRLHVRRGDLSAALTLDQDPGEALRWDPAARTYGFDHAAGHVALARSGTLAAVVAGDFVVEAGQGLILGRAGAFGASGDPADAPLRTSRGVVAYAGAGEDAFFRGGAATVRPGRGWKVDAFASSRRLDAAVEAPVSLIATGLHRTEGERARRGTLAARTIGGAVRWTRGGSHVGAAAFGTRYARPLEPADVSYRHHDASGRDAHGASVFAHLAAGPASLFGEAAWTRGGGGATGGVRLRLAAGSVVAAARWLPARFDAPYGSAFGEQSGPPRNEHGLYVGLRLPLATGWTVSAYADTYRFPWLRYGVARPTTGRDVLLRLRYAPRRWAEVVLQARHGAREERDEHADRPRVLAAVAPHRRTTLRLEATYAFGPRLTLRARLEGARSVRPAPSTARGLLLLHDARLALHDRLRLVVRLALFDVEGFDARLYAYEHDVRYAFTVPAFSGVGSRWYALAAATLAPDLVLEVRYAVTRRLDAAPGDAERDLGLQLRWRR